MLYCAQGNKQEVNIMTDSGKMLTVADVCERLNVHEATVRRWIKARARKQASLNRHTGSTVV